MALEGDNLGHEQRKHRCLVARARADFQCALRTGEFERFRNSRDYVRLRDRLSLADLQRLVGISIVPESDRNKLVARNGGHRFKNARRRNTALADLRLDHYAALISR